HFRTAVGPHTTKKLPKTLRTQGTALAEAIASTPPNPDPDASATRSAAPPMPGIAAANAPDRIPAPVPQTDSAVPLPLPLRMALPQLPCRATASILPGSGSPPPHPDRWAQSAPRAPAT